ncbi:MAG TPA: cold shock and DUF1294 domain-containing protein [Steroidobacteraceae bacterium]|nr:cold shock and DUF1294 domain-containing protein [Steroidobacteraceae bacterium]
MCYQGRLTQWNDIKGFGFVIPTDGGARAFVHIKAFTGLQGRPADGDSLTYSVAKDSRGRLRAIDIRIEGRAGRSARSGSTWVATALVVPFACILAGLVLLGRIPVAIPLIYAIGSLLTFIIYGFDKSAAMNGRHRTPETTLHILSLVGGWPGAFYAQHTMRHKSRKREFQFVFWITVVLNCSALAWATTEDGASTLRRLTGLE